MSAREDEALAEYLAALSNPVRIAILRQLTTPRLLTHIRVSSGAEGGRSLSRQAVREHLDRLLAAGLVAVLPASADGRAGERHVVDHARLFAVVETLRDLAHLRAEDVAWSAETSAASPLRAPSSSPGPSLRLVRGLREGRAFPLDGEGPWEMGRRRDLAVSLDYDPFVSSVHARVVGAPSGHALVDLPDNRNGTTLNWALLERGRSASLRHGDAIGVGRSVLLYWRKE